MCQRGHRAPRMRTQIRTRSLASMMCRRPLMALSMVRALPLSVRVSVDAGDDSGEVSGDAADAQDGTSVPDATAEVDAMGADADSGAFEEPDGKPALADVSPLKTRSRVRKTPQRMRR